MHNAHTYWLFSKPALLFLICEPLQAQPLLILPSSNFESAFS